MKKGWLVIVLVTLCFPGRVCSQIEEELDAEKLLKAQMEASRGRLVANVEARFTCPRYLLRWSMELYQKEAVEEAIEVARIAKSIAELTEKYTSSCSTDLDTRWPQELNDPKIKEKMLAYTKTIQRTTEEYIKYFQSGDEKIINVIDKYLSELEGYDKVIGGMIGEPISKAEDAIWKAKFMCSHWFITLSESWQGCAIDTLFRERGYVKDVVVCPDCVEIVKRAKGINEFFEKEAMYAQDIRFKEKWLNYTKAFRDMADAFIELYKTGDLELTIKLVGDPFEHQKKVFAILEEINEYLFSLQQEE